MGLLGNEFSDWWTTHGGTLGEWAAAVATFAAVLVALVQTKHARELTAQAQADALQAREEGERELLLRELQGRIFWSKPDSPSYSVENGKTRVKAAIENHSARTMFNTDVWVMVNGRGVGSPQRVATEANDKGIVLLNGGRADAWLAWDGAPSNPTAQFLATFQVDRYFFILNEYNDISLWVARRTNPGATWGQELGSESV